MCCRVLKARSSAMMTIWTDLPFLLRYGLLVLIILLLLVLTFRRQVNVSTSIRQLVGNVCEVGWLCKRLRKAIDDSSSQPGIVSQVILKRDPRNLVVPFSFDTQFSCDLCRASFRQLRAR